ncbi:hypothetical protein BDY24DRAFT_93727 [Mrakia frigida]|uniref:uncharacterized protein n=1 Tax=Mrakia frigida TaxID=29902 RepID=UPI003FCC1A74
MNGGRLGNQRGRVERRGSSTSVTSLTLDRLPPRGPQPDTVSHPRWRSRSPRVARNGCRGRARRGRSILCFVTEEREEDAGWDIEESIGERERAAASAELSNLVFAPPFPWPLLSRQNLLLRHLPLRRFLARSPSDFTFRALPSLRSLGTQGRTSGFVLRDFLSPQDHQAERSSLSWDASGQALSSLVASPSVGLVLFQRRYSNSLPFPCCRQDFKSIS